MVILKAARTSGRVAEMFIKKVMYSIILCMLFTSAAFATGVQFAPHPEASPTQPSLKTAPMISPYLEKIPPLIKPENALTKPESCQTRPFQPVLEPIQKFESPLKVGTSSLKPCCDKISLPDAINYALSHNLDIIGNRLDINKAKNDIKTANRLRNPYIQAFLNGGRAATDNPNNVGLIFPIEIAKRGPRKNLAKSNLELTKGNVALAELTLRLDVRQAYIDLVAAKSDLKILNEQRQLLQDLLDIAQKKYDAGAVPEMDVIHAKMTLNQLLIQVNSANTDVYVARYNFNKLLDPEKTNFDTVEDYLPEQNEFISMLTPKPIEKMPNFEEVLSIAIGRRLDLRNAQKDINVAQKNLVVTIRQRVPDIEIGGGYTFVPQTMATDGQYSQGAYIAGNLTNIPLLYRYSPEIKNAKIQVEQKELVYRSLEHKATLDLHSAYDEFITAQDNLNYYNDILLSESKQFLGMSRRSYLVGKSTMVDFIFVEQSYKSIMMGYTQALADYYNAWVNVLREVNDEELKLHG